MGGGRRKPPLTRHRPPLFAHAAAAHHLNRLSMPQKELSTPPFRLAIKISSRFPGWHVVILPLDEYFIFRFLSMCSMGNVCQDVMVAFFIWFSGREGSSGTGMVVLSLQRVYVCMGLNECARCTRRMR